MAFKIYTKTGDKGETALLGGIRVAKNHIRIEAYGTIDELNAWLGFIKDKLENNEQEKVHHIQQYLFSIGSHLACAPDKKQKIKLPSLSDDNIIMLEQWIDSMELELKPLRNFILAGGHTLASKIHIARCVCRRTERICVGLQQIERIDDSIIQYLNRLSDTLFVLARFVQHKAGVEEHIWKG